MTFKINLSLQSGRGNVPKTTLKFIMRLRLLHSNRINSCGRLRSMHGEICWLCRKSWLELNSNLMTLGSQFQLRYMIPSKHMSKIYVSKLLSESECSGMNTSINKTQSHTPTVDAFSSTPIYNFHSSCRAISYIHGWTSRCISSEENNC